jgi:hypothetical protein
MWFSEAHFCLDATVNKQNMTMGYSTSTSDSRETIMVKQFGLPHQAWIILPW